MRESVVALPAVRIEHNLELIGHSDLGGAPIAAEGPGDEDHPRWKTTVLRRAQELLRLLPQGRRRELPHARDLNMLPAATAP